MTRHMMAATLMLVLAACGESDTRRIVGATLEFGETDCGTTALPRTLIVSNPTKDAFNFAITLAGGANSPYLVVPDRGGIVGFNQIEVAVYSKPIPAISAVTDSLYGDTLTVTTDLPGDSPHAVAIKQTAHGAILQFSLPSVDFPGAAAVGAAPQTSAVTINNVGNGAATVTLESPAFSFGFLPSGPQTIAASSSLVGQVSYTPKSVGVISEKLTLKATGPLCAALPTLDATATGTLAGTAKAVALATFKGRINGGGDLLGLVGNGVATMCVLTTSGLVACTGSNQNGMRGAGTEIPKATGFNLVRTATGLLDGVVEISGARGFFCARRQQGQLSCWGDYFGLGHRGFIDPRSINTFATEVVAFGVTSVSTGYAYTCTARDPDSAMTCTGEPAGRSVLPASTWALTGARAVSVSGGGGLALLADGTVMSFGENRAGERGNADPSESPPSLVTGLTGITQVTAGGNSGNHNNRHGCALKDDGTVWCFGRNRHGALGDGTTVNRNAPVQVMVDATTPLSSVTAVSAAQAHTCAITGTGGVSCWGRGLEGALGSVVTGDQLFAIPTDPAITNATSIATKGRATCAVLATGALRCWGELLSQGFTAPTAIAAFEP
jgi:hypothetical protein